jgi:hypothetical protein
VGHSMGNVLKFNNKDNEEIMTEVTYLKSMTGGKEPPADGNWLSLLDNGTIFLVQSKRDPQAFQLGEFILLDKTPKTVYVMSQDAPGRRIPWNPTRFCNQYSLYEIQGIVEIPEIPKDQEEEKNNEQGDRVSEHPPEQTS